MLALQPGDALIIDTGWGKLWEKDNARYQRGNARTRSRKYRYRFSRSSWSSTVSIWLENLKLDELAAKRANEFAFIVEPLKIQGGTGSTVAPIAIR